MCLRSQAHFGHVRLQWMTQAAIFMALLCLIAPISLPFSTVPLSLALFAVALTALILPPRLSITAVTLYLFLGSVGLPVFSGFCGGLGVLLGPTGGYLFAYPFMVLLIGVFANRTRRFWVGGVWGCLMALTLCYTMGTAWYMLVTDTISISAAMIVCVYPFVWADVLKITVALAVARLVQRRLKHVLKQQAEHSTQVGKLLR